MLARHATMHLVKLPMLVQYPEKQEAFKMQMLRNLYGSALPGKDTAGQADPVKVSFCNSSSRFFLVPSCVELYPAPALHHACLAYGAASADSSQKW